MTPHKREAEPTHENQSPKRSRSEVTGVSSKSEEAASADASKVTFIEADASEDKGCRQRMEDAWVLLPDSSLENSENLSTPAGACGCVRECTRTCESV